MAILQPTLLQIPAFDATNDYTFRFSVPLGSDQVVKNRLIITNQLNGEVIYNQTITTAVLSHTLPANTLSNSSSTVTQQYSAQVSVFNAQNVESAYSVAIPFYCYETPSFALIAVPSIVTNANFEFSLAYSQNAGELLNAYKFNLYDAQGTQIQTSNVLYVGDKASPYSYTFSGLLNNTQYSIDATGITVNNTELYTGKTDFTVQYTQPSAGSLISLQSNNCGGYVIVTSNMSTIDGTAYPSPPTYIDDEKIDLSQDGSYVVWEEGLLFSGDFKAQIWFNPTTPNNKVWTLTDKDGVSINVRYCQGYEGVDSTLKVYVDCIIQGQIVNTYIYSSYIDLPELDDMIQIVLTKQGNYFTINIYNLGQE